MKTKTIISSVDVKKKKQTFYDKRLIREIVKQVENDMPRAEAIATYGMSRQSLDRWMKVYGSEAYLNSRPRQFKDSERRSMVRAIKSGMSLADAESTFGVNRTTLRGWIVKFAENNDLGGSNPVVMSKKPTDTLTSDEVRALQKALAEEKLKVAGLNTLIDIAEEHLKIDIRKKSGAKQSSK